MRTEKFMARYLVLRVLCVEKADSDHKSVRTNYFVVPCHFRRLIKRGDREEPRRFGWDSAILRVLCVEKADSDHKIR
ncbi:hypothetical protein QUF72_20970 [Desulfobacterales bacterium HSG2]|nr:hypothetical protein [Desulfobacterales bacterium HSG2]